MMSRIFTFVHNALMVLSLLALMCQGNTAHAQANGGQPEANLILGKDGNLYGTAPFYGAYGYGTVFKITPWGSFTLLHSFNISDGAYPYGGLTLGPDGNFYGTTNLGGDYGVGTIFKITPSGTLTTIHSFGWVEGAEPAAGLAIDNDGNLYGTTMYGGDFVYGTVFKCAPDGTVTLLHSFNGTDGFGHFARLKLEKNVLYGTTLVGGNNVTLEHYAYGTVYKITVDGQFTNLYTFDGVDGAYPYSVLTPGKDGNFYGTTQKGGAQNLGMVYRITPNGTMTNIHSFDASQGRYPTGTLLRDVYNDDGFYGTTTGSLGGTGTIFKIGYDGVVTFLHTYTNLEGEFSVDGLLWRNGKMYAAGYQGGIHGLGTLFEFSLPGIFTKLFDF